MYRVVFEEWERIPYDNRREKFIEDCRHTETKKEYLFKTKEAAWNFFSQSLAEHYEYRDFWADVDWSDYCVISSHYDEGGSNSCTLYKWEGFDKDVELGWKYNGYIYDDLRALWEECPIFEGQRMITDQPCVVSKDGNEVAKLVAYFKK